MEILGYCGALLVGLSLGIFGAGGSIITIPVLIYLFRIEALHATTYSFFIVGVTALTGAAQHIRRGTVKVMPALYFAVAGMLSIWLIRRFLINLIPDTLFSLGDIPVTKDVFIFIFFSLVMAAAGISMIRSKHQPVEGKAVAHPSPPFLIALGFATGIIIAFAGVGGGFLITPALVMFARLPVKTAIGTSLCVISLNSLVGFLSSIQLHEDMDWLFLVYFISVTIVGILIGSAISKRINSVRLKIIFGWVILAMSVFIILNELYLST